MAILSLFSGCSTAVSEEELFEFILPPKDTELIYSSKEGNATYTRLLSVNGEKATFEDRIEIPESVEAALPQPLGDLGIKDGYLHDRYSYDLEKDQIIRRDKEGDHILLKGPLQASGSTWETRVVTIEEQVQNEERAECSIQKIENERVLKQQRKTLTVDCVHNETNGDTVIFRIRFAKGLGIIEKSIHDFGAGSTSTSSVTPAVLIQLKDIRQYDSEELRKDP